MRSLHSDEAAAQNLNLEVAIQGPVLDGAVLARPDPGEGTLQDAIDDAVEKGVVGKIVIELKNGVYTAKAGVPVFTTRNIEILIRAQEKGKAILNGTYEDRVGVIDGGTVVLDGLVITGGRPRTQAGPVSIKHSSNATMPHLNAPLGCSLYCSTVAFAGEWCLCQ